VIKNTREKRDFQMDLNQHVNRKNYVFARKSLAQKFRSNKIMTAAQGFGLKKNIKKFSPRTATVKINV